MSDEHTDLRIDVAVLKNKLENLEKSLAGRATREWAIVMTGLGLIGTIVVKNLGWLP